MLRRQVFLAITVLAAGCSPKSRRKSKVAGQRDRLHKGPQTFGGVLVQAYVDDLKGSSKPKQLVAARELGNMGSGAKEALPALEKLARAPDAEVRAAVKAAIVAIRK
jgi:hypothetical protein